MNLCRCPHCQATFQVSIPADSQVWEKTPIDDDGLALWVCLDCHRKGMPPLDKDDIRSAEQDPFRHGGP